MADEYDENAIKSAAGYADLHALSEDDRIDVMAAHVRKTGQPCLVVTDDIPGKAERYQRKFRERHPDIVVLDETPKTGPTPGARAFRIGAQ